MKPKIRSLLPLVLVSMVACSTTARRVAPTAIETQQMMSDFVAGEIREVRVDDGDDLLTAGLGIDGLRGPLAAFADPVRPSAVELRRRAIHASWKGIADLGPLGRYGELYGSTATIPGREFHAFARLPGANASHRVMVQVPDRFDAKQRCLVVTASSGSRGIYGAIAVAGAAGLPRGCAVAYTDKGAGSGWFDAASGTGVALDGTRATSGTMPLEFDPADISSDAGVAVKHAHSGDNPEASWGDHVLQAARFGLAMLDRALPSQAPFTADNTRVIAIGLSNGGGAVLQAAGNDEGLFDAVIALAPNVHVPGHGRALYDYVSEAATWLPCALLDARYDAVPFARVNGTPPPSGRSHCKALQDSGLVTSGDAAAQARRHLVAQGWTDAAIATAAASTQFDLWRAVGATYASAYLRRKAGDMPCGFRFEIRDAGGQLIDAPETMRAAWWSDSSGIPPGAGVALAATAAEALADVGCLRRLWTGDDVDAEALRRSVVQTQAALPRADLPLVVIHGSDDGLVPMAFSGLAYVDWLRANGRDAVWWPIAHAQHFDAFLVFPGFGDRHVPLLPYGYSAFDRVLGALVAGTPLALPLPTALARGSGALQSSQLGLP